MLFNCYLIFFFIIAFSLLVILVKNPIISVLFLVLVFFFSVMIFIYFGAEFLALFMLIVYVGAISILFLFVIMMLNLRIVELLDLFLNYLPIGSIIGFFFFFEVFYFLEAKFFVFDYYEFIIFIEYIKLLNFRGNLQILGEVLFNYNSYYVIIASLILFVSMVGSIIITFEKSFDLECVPLSDISSRKEFISLWKSPYL